MAANGQVMLTQRKIVYRLETEEIYLTYPVATYGEQQLDIILGCKFETNGGVCRAIKGDATLLRRQPDVLFF